MTSGALLNPGVLFANRSHDRRLTSLDTVCRGADGQSSPVELLDLSETGFLIRALQPIANGLIEICLPDAGIRQARTVWCQNGLLGCEFTSPVNRATVSATLLQSPPSAPATGPYASIAADDPIWDLSSEGSADGKLHGALRLAIISAAAVVPWVAIAGIYEAIRAAV